MRKILALLLIVLTSQMALARERLIIQSATPDTIQSVAGYELDLRRPLAMSGFYLFDLPEGIPEEMIDEIEKALAIFPGVISVERDIMLQHTFVPDDTRYNEQWHYYEAIGGIGLPDAWDTAAGTGVVVAVIDTGIVPHSDLNANIINGYDFISNAGTANDGNGRDADASDPGDWEGFFECGFTFGRNSSWHGTHVAGTVAAVTNNGNDVAGVAFTSRVLVVRALGKCGGTLSDIADGIIWASGGTVPSVPANPNPAQVINLSLGGSSSCGSTMQSAINIAVGNGTTVVTAAGNGNTNVSGHVPSNCNNVIAVAANDREGNRASYSNFGAGIDVTAPGGETAGSSANGVLSTLNNGSQGPTSETLEFYQGTSMAAPHVAGAVAILYDIDPSITPAEVEQLLKDTARPLPGTCSGGCGAGIIDVAAAIGTEPPTGLPVANFIYDCDGLVCDFTDTSSPVGPSVPIYQWFWDFDGIAESTEQNPTYTFGSAGSYEVCLNVVDENGYAAENDECKTVVVNDPPPNEPPTASFTYSCDELICDFTDTSTDSDGTVEDWNWSFGDGGNSVLENPSHTYASEGTYQVCHSVDDDDGDESANSCQNVTVEDAPEPPPCRFFFFGRCWG